jgi:hypothetical protein
VIRFTDCTRRRAYADAVKPNIAAALLLTFALGLVGWALLDWVGYTTFSDSLVWWM